VISRHSPRRPRRPPWQGRRARQEPTRELAWGLRRAEPTRAGTTPEIRAGGHGSAPHLPLRECWY
jgi:hypothetical protein